MDYFESVVGIAMDWVRILAYITGTVDQELLLRNEYLAAENRILKAQLKTPLRLTDAERVTLAEIAHRLDRKALEDVANIVKPDTLMGWYRRLGAHKFDGSESRRYPGRPRIDAEIEQLVVRMAKENSDWGYDRILGAMANLGYRLSDQTVGNILQRHGIPSAPERQRTTTWNDFIRAHRSVLAGTDFRNVTMDEWGFLEGCRYLIHDRDTKFTDSFHAIDKSGHVEPLKLPARSPNLNAYAERWVKSVKEEFLSKLILK